MSTEELNLTPEDIEVTPDSNIEDDPFAGLGESPTVEPEEEVEEVADTPAEAVEAAADVSVESVTPTPAPRTRGARGMPNHIPVRYHVKDQPYANRVLTVDRAEMTGVFTMTENDGKVRTFSFEVDNIVVE